MKPDVLHCQHTLESMGLLEMFPEIPALFMVHDSRSWHDRVPTVSRLSALVAVDDVCLERIIRETGLPSNQCDVIHNSVDMSLFSPRGPLPDRPLKAAIFTSNAANDHHVQAVREVCGRLGIALDELGPAAGRFVTDPENWLPSYDLVFGKGRCALEAMAVGCAVILIGSEGVGELVTPDNFHEFKKRNFGFSLLLPGMDQNFLEDQIRSYSASKASEVQKLVHRFCTLDIMVEAFQQLYAELPARTQFTPVLQDKSISLSKALLGEFAIMSNENLRLSKFHQESQNGPLEHNHDDLETISLLRQGLKSTDANLSKQRERAEHYRKEAKKYKTKVLQLKERAQVFKQKRKSLWEQIKSGLF